jgi:hypothetical protein
MIIFANAQSTFQKSQKSKIVYYLNRKAIAILTFLGIPQIIIVKIIHA